MSLKNPVTTPGIDPGTVRLVAQRLNHYAPLYVGFTNYYWDYQNEKNKMDGPCSTYEEKVDTGFWW